MDQTESFSGSSKISPGFAARLASLGHGEMIRAIVLLESKSGGTVARTAGDDYDVELPAENVEAVFSAVDDRLAQTGGRRLTDTPNRLGYIVVESTAQGIQVIADLDWVSVVMEDQALRMLRPPGGDTKPRPAGGFSTLSL